MNKILALALILCLAVSQVQCIRMVNKNNTERAISLFHLTANTFLKQYGGITLNGLGFFQNFADIKYKDMKLQLVPEQSDDGEEKVYNGTLEVEDLTFKAVSQFDETDFTEVKIAKLVANFKLFSNNAFLSMDELKFDSENELYQNTAKNIQTLFNMAIIRSLRPIYDLLHSEKYDEQAIVQDLLDAFKQKHNELNPLQPGEDIASLQGKPFVVEVNTYLNRRKPDNRKADQEIVIENLEQLEELNLSFNLGAVGERQEDNKPKTEEL